MKDLGVRLRTNLVSEHPQVEQKNTTNSETSTNVY